ncbi:hypothetical protein GOHSU_04_01390 [Gordonia hirsuta DSM 44140 = NBRC 16056]|uniref:Methyltransferase n=1 Tax=Gordonia hirsuta DSM 44140 = NBRC 16056 TaxID=1121927 RepID=L7L548_9ACTN|nr:hypothetical protein GOHSU_04_01390 [Gordonia hirsuta DSM 44140 = NBRC 16056]
MIHTAPDRMQTLLAESARCLAPRGSLFVGFFAGSRVELFGQAVTTAYFWPVDEMASELERAGFQVVGTHTRGDPGSRRHADITAVLRCHP